MARKVSVLKGYYRFLVRENAISQDPTELITVLVKEKKLPKHLSVKEVFQFLHSMSGHNEQSVRDRALFEFWYATGCRVSELTTLAADSVDLSDGLVKVLGKGNRERWIPLNRVAVEWLTKYKDVRHRWLQKLGTAASPIFFLSQRGLPLTRQGMWRLLKTRAQEAGIERAVWPHLIRHTFATHVLRGGADLRSVQELLGHRSIAATEIYTHLSVENLKDMQRKYHPRG
jgi:integrase/recombinase XerD